MNNWENILTENKFCEVRRYFPIIYPIIITYNNNIFKLYKYHKIMFISSKHSTMH